MTSLHVCVYVSMVMLCLHRVTCQDVDENIQPNDTVPIPEALTMKDFMEHVIDFEMKEVLWIHPTNTSKQMLFGARVVVSQIKDGVFSIRVAGNEVNRDKHEVVCRNNSEIVYNVDKSTALFMDEDGTRFIFYSKHPHRYIWLMRCENWEPLSIYCPIPEAYGSAYVKGDDDIEYYDYDETDDDDKNDDDDDKYAPMNKLSQMMAMEARVSPDRVFRRNYNFGQGNPEDPMNVDKVCKFSDADQKDDLIIVERPLV